MVEQKQTVERSKTIPLAITLLLMIIGLLSLNLYTANKELKQEESHSLALNESLLQFQKIVILNNVDYIKEEIKAKFPNADEFRIISYDGSSKRFSLSVLIGKPIVDEQSSIGYNYNNLYFIRTAIDENNLKIEKIEKGQINVVQKQKHTEDTSSSFFNNFANAIIDTAIKVSDYVFPGLQIEKNTNTLNSMMEDINKMILESQKDSIEKPILLIKNM